MISQHGNTLQDDTVSDSEPRDTPENPASARKSRMDREIEEILADRNNALPPPPSKPRRKRPVTQRPARLPSPSISDVASGWAPRLLGAPILLALVAALMAILIAGSSQLLANLFAFVAVALVLLPIVQRFRSPATRPESRMWRGQVIDPRSEESSPVSQLKRWWSSQRR